MANVPNYGDQNQTLRPGARGSISTNAGAGDFGGGVADATVQLGGATREAAAAVAAVRAIEDRAVVEDRLNLFSADTRRLAYDPETGFTNMLGANAVQGREKYDKDIEAARLKHANGLTPAQQTLYDRAAAARRDQALDTGIRHTSAQRRAWADSTSVARIKTLNDDAIAMYREPENFKMSMNAALAEIKERGKRLGWSPEDQKVMRKEFTSGVHRSVVYKLAIDDPLAAKDWLDKNRKAMVPSDYLAMDNALDGPVYARRGEIEAGRIIAGGQAERPPRVSANPGDHGPYEPIGVDDLEPGGEFALFKERAGDRVSATSSEGGDVMEVDVRHLNAQERVDIIKAAIDSGYNGLGIGLDTITFEVGPARVWGQVPGYAEEVVGGHIKDTPDDSAFSGPLFVMDQVGGIKDQKLRVATAQALQRFYETEEARSRQIQRRAFGEAENWILENPSANPLTDLPIETQQAVGTRGMTALINFTDTVRRSGDVETDEVLFAKLQRDQARDPYGFAESIQLVEYADRLSIEDRRTLNEGVVRALTDIRNGENGARTDGRQLTEALEVAETMLWEAGLLSKSDQRDNGKVRAEFQRFMTRRVREFYDKEQRQPDDFEVRELVDQAMIKAIVKKPGIWNDEELHLFQMGRRGDNTTVELLVEYDEITYDLRKAIIDALTLDYGREPTKDEVEDEYRSFLMGSL